MAIYASLSLLLHFEQHEHFSVRGKQMVRRGERHLIMRAKFPASLVHMQAIWAFAAMVNLSSDRACQTFSCLLDTLGFCASFIFINSTFVLLNQNTFSHSMMWFSYTATNDSPLNSWIWFMSVKSLLPVGLSQGIQALHIEPLVSHNVLKLILNCTFC